MRVPHVLIAALTGTFAIQFGFGAPPADSEGSRIPRSDVLKSVRPEYPLEARRQHETGSGVVIIHIDRPTGHVTSVTVHKSTGYKLLDDAAIKAFTQWRFRPGAVTTDKIWMPISFKGT